MKRSTLITLVVFLLLVGLTLYLQQREPTKEVTDATPVEPVEFLLSETDGIPTSIDIRNDSGERVQIIRDEDGLWVLEKPIKTEASQGSAEAAATQLSSLRIVSHPDVAPDIVGLDPASYTMTVKLSSGEEKSVRIGDLTPTESGYYADVNKSEEVLILSKSGIDALLVLLTSPPYENTPTP